MFRLQAGIEAIRQQGVTPDPFIAYHERGYRWGGAWISESTGASGWRMSSEGQDRTLARILKPLELARISELNCEDSARIRSSGQL
uniref:Uncharacterized protein n=1 Tax=Sphaerodactylus townsendi TaxID=933632 RepID=A0ACB8G3F8_9SAUR